MEKDILLERYELSADRIRELAETVPEAEGTNLPAEAADYFKSVARYLCGLFTDRDGSDPDFWGEASGKWIDTERLPENHGRLLAGLYQELQNVELFARAGWIRDVVIRLELFLEVYSAYICAWQEKGNLPEAESISRIFYWFAFDYADVAAEQYVKEFAGGDMDAVCLNSSSILYGFLPLQDAGCSRGQGSERTGGGSVFVPDKAYLSRRLEAFRMALEKQGVSEREREEYCRQAKKYVAHLG